MKQLKKSSTKSSSKKIFFQNPDLARKKGLRPVVVACIVSQKRILFVYKKAYSLWLLPQGGIEPKETPENAIKRELSEELGSFAKKIDYRSLRVITQDKIYFPKEHQGKRELYTKEGDSVFMKGKLYYLVRLYAKTRDLDITESEFEKYRWVTLEESQNLVRHIYQKGKQRITKKALLILAQNNDI